MKSEEEEVEVREVMNDAAKKKMQESFKKDVIDTVEKKKMEESFQNLLEAFDQTDSQGWL